mgnify:CR=1 FL=1
MTAIFLRFILQSSGPNRSDISKQLMAFCRQVSYIQEAVVVMNMIKSSC